MRQIHAIVNAAAGGGRAGRAWPAIADAIRSAGVDLIEHFTTGPGDAARIARERVLHNAAEVLAAGGDGTINEIVNGLTNNGAIMPASCVLSLMPLGSGSDLARNLGIRTTDHALHALRSDLVESIDIGIVSTGGSLAQRRAFVNSADIGLGACVAARVQQSRKLFGGRAAYLLAALREIGIARPIQLRVKVDGAVVHDGPTFMALTVNGRCYGGGMVAAPTASVTDGLLDVVVLKRASRFKLAFSLLPRVYRGTHLADPAVISARGRVIEVECNRTIELALDGEVEQAESVRISVLPGAARVRVPAPTARISWLTPPRAAAHSRFDRCA